MASWREKKAAAREDLHREFEVDAYYFPPGTGAGDEEAVSVRVHYEFGLLGDVKGTSFGYAERRELDEPQLIFWLADKQPQRKALITISADEGYCLDHLDPKDLQTQKAYVTRMKADDLAALPNPIDNPPGP